MVVGLTVSLANSLIMRFQKVFMRLLLLLLMGLSCSATWAEEEDPSFDIMEYRVEGNSVLTTGRIEEAVYPFLGEAKNIGTVEKARSALEKAYHDAGYLTVTVNIPEQNVDKGTVSLQVLEGRVERLRVVGSRYYSLGVIKSRVPELAEGNVPYFPDVQAQLATVNTTADRQVAPVLRAGKSPGKVEVDLKVQDQLPFHGSVELNDRYSANTTHSRLNGSVSYANLWQRDHSLSLSFQVTPENTRETKVLSATYLIPSGGDYWATYGVVSDSNVAAVGDVNVIGKGAIFGLRYIHPLPSLETYTHRLTLGVDRKDFKESLLLGADRFTTPIAYTPFFAGYDSTLQGMSSTSEFSFNVTASVRGLGNDEQQFKDKRYLAKPDFAYVRADVKHTQGLPKNWQMYARVSGQMANEPLISNEGFAIGGVDTVRGYLESSALGDMGMMGSVELRTPPLGKYLSDKPGELYAFAFHDRGHVRILDPLPAQTEAFDLASVGLGLRFKKWRGLSGELNYARALKQSGQVKAGDTRLHLSIGYEW